MTIRKHAPCYKCEERHENCHSECEKYKEYKEKMKMIHDAKVKEQELESYTADAAKRMKTRRF